MGSAEEGYPRKPPSQQQHHYSTKSKLKILLLLIFSNLFTIYIFTSSGQRSSPSISSSAAGISTSSALSSFINLSSDTHHDHDEYTSTTQHLLQQQLNSTQAQITDLHQRLLSSNSLLETLLSELGRLPRPDGQHHHHSDYDDMSEELQLSILPQKLPLGYSPRMGSDEVHPPVGAGCLRFKDELNEYMKYNVGGVCPMDDIFAQRLILKGCEPLPRRRCHPKTPVGYVDPTPYPTSLWTTPPDKSIVWDPYNCKSYRCLIDRKNEKGYFDCKDCFDLGGREKTRWLFDNGGLDYGLDEVLRTKPAGTIRIGFDIGGGTGTFAARMRERNVTIITSSMNLDGPFNSFIASRGLIAMHLSVSQRLPFFENTLDIVHSMHVLSNWIPNPMLEFTLYDIYRVLRPGGLFWLDRFFCLGSQLNATYVPMIDQIGFKKLRWNAGMKLDRGVEKNEWYFSALLEKPLT